MWVSQVNNKYKYSERFIDPYTEKSRVKSVTLSSQSPQAWKKAQKILTSKIKIELNEVRQTDATFSDVFNKWYKVYIRKLRPGSVQTAQSVKKVIDTNFRTDALVDKIDTRLLQDFLDSLNYSNEYMSSIKSMLNLLFIYARKNDYIQINPMNEVTLHLRAKTEADYEKIDNKFLEQDQAEKLITELYRRPSTYRLGHLAEFMYLTGTRIGEATILRPDNFNFEQKYVEITGTLDRTNGYKNARKGPTKTAKGTRRIEMTNRCVELVRRTIEDNQATKLVNANYVDQGFIFVTKSGTPIQVNSFNLALKRAGNRVDLGYKSLSAHIFRHTHVSLLAEKMIPKQAIMERIGHSDSRVTDQIYTHVTHNMKANILKKLEDSGL